MVAEKIIDFSGKEVVLSVPRFSKLAESAANFRLLKREAEALGKRLIIESVDDKVIELSHHLDLECVNPFFTDSPKRFSDIKVNRPIKETHEEGIHHKKEIKSHEVYERLTHDEPPARLVNSTYRHKRSFGHFGWWLIGFTALAGSAVFLGLVILPKAEITIKTARTAWAFNDSVAALKAITEIDPKQAKIPGQLFSERKNLQISFPASGKKNVSTYAGGTIIVYNAHSSSPQVLVAKTRFAAPDGKIFRLTDKLTVPGAKIVDGKIQPSSIEARVVADQTGADYNIGPVAKFTIPGFAGTPKFETFYAESKASMSGGFIGEAAYPTAEDLKSAKESASASLEDSMKALILAQLPEGVKLVQGAMSFKIIEQTIDTSSGTDGKFLVSTTAEVTLMVFRESDLIDLLLGRIKDEAGSEFTVKSYELKYGQPKLNTQIGELRVPVDYQSVLAKKIDIDSLKTKLAGKSEPEVRALIFSVAGLESAQISLWPFWIRRVPDDDKINIVVD